MRVHRVLGWIRAHHRKMDRPLRKSLLAILRPHKRTPCFLHRAIMWWKSVMRRENIIVVFEDSLAKEERSQAEQMCERYGRIHCHLHKINGISMRASGRNIERMIRQRAVKKMYLDREVQAVLDVASPTVKADQVWDKGKQGNGVTVAVLDTGIEPHQDVQGRITAFQDFTGGNGGTTEPYDDNGHGTHVAGAVAGDGSASGGRYRGVAPQANLVGVKVLDKMGSGSLSTIIQGVEWCIDHKEEHDIRVLNLSLGAEAISPCIDDPLCQIAEEAWAEGMVVCVAAGNEGPEEGTIGTPGNAPSVLTVGAMDDRDTPEREDDDIAPFSSRGPTVEGRVKPDVVAPGVDIVSLNVPGSVLAKQMGKNDAQYVAMSGTSMATPICAGIVALLLEMNPDLNPAQIKRTLMQTAEDRGLDENSQGEGYVDAKRAADRFLSA